MGQIIKEQIKRGQKYPTSIPSYPQDPRRLDRAPPPPAGFPCARRLQTRSPPPLCTDSDAAASKPESSAASSASSPSTSYRGTIFSTPSASCSPSSPLSIGELLTSHSVFVFFYMYPLLSLYMYSCIPVEAS
jgi:hypothetical protein